MSGYQALSQEETSANLGDCVDQFINCGCSRWTGICQLSGVQTVCSLCIHVHSGLCLLIRKIGASQSICQGCMLCFSLSGLWQICSVQADWKFKPRLCVCHAGGILVLVCHWLLDYIMCTVLQFVSILGVIFLQDWITWHKTSWVYQIKLFYTFFAACQNQAVNNTALYGPFLIFLKTWRQENTEVKRFIYTIWAFIEVKLAVGSTCFHSFKSIFLIAFGCMLSRVHDNSEQWIGNKM